MLSELRRRTRHGLIPMLGLAVLVYIGFHAIQGDRGLIAYLQLTSELDKAKAVFDGVSAERAVLEHRTSLLRPEKLDLDMLDERVRAVLLYVDPRDVIIETVKTGSEGK